MPTALAQLNRTATPVLLADAANVQVIIDADTRVVVAAARPVPDR